MSTRAGLLVRRHGELSFLPSSTVRSLVGLPRITQLPWDCAGMALIAGEIVAVIELGEPSGVLVLCEVDGCAFALSGLFAERVGAWPESPEGVRVDGVAVPMLDLRTPLARFRRSSPPQKDRAP